MPADRSVLVRSLRLIRGSSSGSIHHGPSVSASMACTDHRGTLQCVSLRWEEWKNVPSSGSPTHKAVARNGILTVNCRPPDADKSAVERLELSARQGRRVAPQILARGALLTDDCYRPRIRRSGHRRPTLVERVQPARKGPSWDNWAADGSSSQAVRAFWAELSVKSCIDTVRTRS